MRPVWIVIDHGRGGVADYGHVQANALADLGMQVEVLCPPEFAESHPGPRYGVHPTLKGYTRSPSYFGVLQHKISIVAVILENMRRVHVTLKRAAPGHLITHFAEYLAPMWRWRMSDLARRGWTMNTILHDPTRNYQVGPAFWHRWSVKEAFSFLDTAFVHGSEHGDAPSSTTVVTIPHGPYEFSLATRTTREVRDELGLNDTDILLVSFGFIRDNKNLDLVIEALAGVPNTHLVVIGSEQGGGGKTIAWYQDLCVRLGCDNRVHWRIGFHSQEFIADYLCAADLSALTYSAAFKSASGAMSASLHYRLPCLVSGGSRSTAELVSHYGIGVWIEPDSATAIRDGIQQWINHPPAADWEAYARENSWESNAEIIRDRLKALEDGAH